MKNNLFIPVLFFISAIASAQVTPADEKSPYSNSGDTEMYKNFVKLNASDAYLSTTVDSKVSLADSSGGNAGTYVTGSDNIASLALKANLASPTFTGTVTIPSPFTLGSTSVTTTGAKLNYLTSATGTTGTNTTNIVFSTSPTLVTPALGTPSALVGTNITGTGASFTAGAVTGFTPASGSLTLAGADAVTLTTTAATNVTLPTSGTLVASSVTDLLAPIASPTFTGTVTAPIISQTATVSERTILVSIDSTKLVGSAAGDLAHVDGAILVAAPAAGILLEFVSAVFIYDYSTAAFGGGANDVVVQVGASGTQVTVSSAITSASLLTAAEDKIIRLGSIATELAVPTAGAISINGTLLTNPGTAAGVLRVHLTYRIHTTGL